MGRIVSAYVKGFGQLSDPGTRSVVFMAVAGSIAVFVGLFATLVVVLKATTFIAVGFLETLFDVVVLTGAPVLTYFLFPAVVTALSGLLLDKVVRAVEVRHYPELSEATGQTFLESLGPTLKFLGTTVGLNLLCLPLLIFPPLFFLVFWALNGYLLSREYFELVALRRLSPDVATALRTKWKTPLFIAGIGYAMMLTVPILNILTPVIATAITVHLFESWRTKDGVIDKTPTPRTKLES